MGAGKQKDDAGQPRRFPYNTSAQAAENAGVVSTSYVRVVWHTGVLERKRRPGNEKRFIVSAWMSERDVYYHTRNILSNWDVRAVRVLLQYLGPRTLTYPSTDLTSL